MRHDHNVVLLQAVQKTLQFGFRAIGHVGGPLLYDLLAACFDQHLAAGQAGIIGRQSRQVADQHRERLHVTAEQA